jgi:aspartate/tyrosine/aromatic aminotransferase
MNPKATVYIPNQTWRKIQITVGVAAIHDAFYTANHPMMLKIQNMPFQNYRYFNESTGLLDFTGMMADLKSMPEGSVVLLHAWLVAYVCNS